jgi:hypothetical protein
VAAAAAALLTSIAACDPPDDPALAELPYTWEGVHGFVYSGQQAQDSIEHRAPDLGFVWSADGRALITRVWDTVGCTVG